MSDALGPGVFNSFIHYLFNSGDISVPAEYHERCSKIQEMLDSDVSGTINTVLDYSINAASEAKYRVECSSDTLEKLLNIWLEKINIDIRGVPTGLEALSKEYFKERWEGSSFCVLKVADWEKISVGNVTIEVPTTMYFVNGSSIYVARPKDKNYTIGSDKFYLDKENKIVLPGKDEDIIVQKPYNRWFDEYATPYLIRRGVYKNWLGIKTLQDKSDEVISKVLPYLFLITKGTKEMFDAGLDYSDTELTELTNNFKSEVEKYKNQKGKTPTNAIPFDTKYEHLIPDMSKVLKEELYRQGYRTILAGLGFVDMLEISPSRQETRLNPKAFVSEINDGVSGFKAILLEAISLIEQKNKGSHGKIFSDKGKLTIVNSALKINIEQMLDFLRSGFDRGPMSIQTYQESLGLDPQTEKDRRIKEDKEGLNDLFYPHVLTNNEQYPNDPGKVTVQPAKPKTKKQENLEDENKNPNSPESKDFKNATEELIVVCKECKHEFDLLSVPEAGMGYSRCPKCNEVVTQKDAKVINEPIDPNLEIAPYQNLEQVPNFIKKMPKHAQEIFMSTFNSVYEETQDESKAMAIAISSAKRWLKKEGYIYNKEKKIWEKK
jgi:cation transport regulator ChaB